MSRYCYTRDPNGDMHGLIASCVNFFSVPANGGNSYDCLVANMTCADPLFYARDTVYVEVPVLADGSVCPSRPECPACSSAGDLDAFLYAVLAVFILGSFFAGISFGGK